MLTLLRAPHTFLTHILTPAGRAASGGGGVQQGARDGGRDCAPHPGRGCGRRTAEATETGGEEGARGRGRDVGSLQWRTLDYP